MMMGFQASRTGPSESYFEGRPTFFFVLQTIGRLTHSDVVTWADIFKCISLHQKILRLFKDKFLSE